MSEQLEAIRRIEDLLRVLVKNQLSEAMETCLRDPKRKRLYELTGTGTIRQLSTKTGYSIAQISRIWQEWERAGLLVKEGQQYKKVL